MLIQPPISSPRRVLDRLAIHQEANSSTSKPTTGEPIDTVSFQEQAIRSTVVGASLGTVAGESLGKFALVGASGYLGWRVGESLAGPAAGVVGALLGSGASYLLERKVPIGGNLGAVSGFLTGGIIGGITGTVIGGVQAIAHANPFQ